MTIKFLNLKKQYLSIKEEIDDAIFSVMDKAQFVGGNFVSKFEKDFASYQNVKHCIGVGNGTDAIEIVLKALELPKGSEIIVPANSFIASSEAVTTAGYKVIFCDCDENTYNISLSSLKSKITPNTKAIIAVHLYGQPAELEGLVNLAKEHNLFLIEDSAQAHGAEYKEVRVGNFGIAATFSFYPGKNLGAYGDAGAILTNNDELAKKCIMISNHGRIDKYDHIFEGRNSRLDAIQAAILSVKLKHLDKWTEKRIQIANLYKELLSDCKEIILPQKLEHVKHVYHLFVIRTNKRDELQKYLKDNEIETGIHYPISLPNLKAYQYLGESDPTFFANQNDSKLLSLPIGEHLEISEVEYICSKIKDFLGNN